MTLIAETPPLFDQTVTVVPEQTGSRKRPVRSPVRTVVVAIAVAMVVVMASTATLVTLIGEASLIAAVGFGAYCAFWLGGGFGLIFGSAAAFRSDH